MLYLINFLICEQIKILIILKRREKSDICKHNQSTTHRIVFRRNFFFLSKIQIILKIRKLEKW